jgi:hypothetical protein
MTTMTEMIVIGIHGTRAVRRVAAALRAGQSRRHNKRRGLAAEGGRSARAIVRVNVVLSAAKDLIAACHRHEILRFAQDDRREFGYANTSSW